MHYLLRRRRLGHGSCRGISADSTQGIQVVRNDAALPVTTGFVFRWGCTSTVPAGGRIVNTAEAIHWCADKRASRLELQEKGISVPKTWGSIYDEAEWEGVGERYSVVVRKSRHAQGRDLYVPADFNALETLCGTFGEGAYYISRLINKVAEYRVFVCQGRAVWVVRKTPGNPDQVAWNVAQGGRFDNIRWDEWPLRVVKEAIKAHLISGLDFSGVDVMVDAEGTPYILELNSAPSQTSPYRQGCVAKAFDYIVANNSKEVIPLREARGGWKKFIHPSLSEEAWV